MKRNLERIPSLWSSETLITENQLATMRKGKEIKQKGKRECEIRE